MGRVFRGSELILFPNPPYTFVCLVNVLGCQFVALNLNPPSHLENLPAQYLAQISPLPSNLPKVFVLGLSFRVVGFTTHCLV